jgi:hypothetical protein
MTCLIYSIADLSNVELSQDHKQNSFWDFVSYLKTVLLAQMVL